MLNKLPQSMQGKAKQALRDIYLAESRQTAEAALDRFKNLSRISNLIQTSRPSGGLERLYS